MNPAPWQRRGQTHSETTPKMAQDRGPSHPSSGVDRPLPRWTRIRRRAPALVLSGVLVVGLATLIVVVALHREREVRVERSSLVIATVAVENFADTVAFRAQLVPSDLVLVPAPESGRVVEIFAEVGAVVRQGQPLLQLANPEREQVINARVAQIQSEIGALRNQEIQVAQSRYNDRRAVLDAQFNLTRVSKELVRKEPLVAFGIVAEAEVTALQDESAFHSSTLTEAQRTADSNEKLRVQQLGAIDEQRRVLLDNFAAARRQLLDFKITAPRAGQLIALDANPGEFLAAGAEVAQIAAGTGVRIEAQLDEFYAGKITPALAGQLTIDGVRFPVRVTKAYPQIVDGSFRVDLAFVESISTSAPTFRAGQAAEGSLTLGGSVKAMVLPNAAFMQATNGTWVYVVDPAGNRAERRAIKLGRRSPERVEIVEGLKAGERVVVSEYDSFGDADSLRL